MFHHKKRKTIHLIRHCQSIFNVPPHDAQKLDPDLTITGIQQAINLGKSFPHLSSIDLVVASPLRRALNTAIHAFGDHVAARQMQIIALPELQELSQWPCDTGSSLANLLTEFREHPVDLGLLGMDWDSKDGYFAPTERRSIQRVKNARQWLRERPEEDIVVVGHGHCLQLLADEGNYHDIRAGLCLPEWENGEWRSYHFENREAGGEKVLVETKESMKRRRKKTNLPVLEPADSIPRPATVPMMESPPGSNGKEEAKRERSGSWFRPRRLASADSRQ